MPTSETPSASNGTPNGSMNAALAQDFGLADKPEKQTNGVGDLFKNVDFAPRFSYFKSVTHRATNLHWKNLQLRIKDKQILKGVSGHVFGGEVCALMGPSGSGKSSTLNVLAGRVIPTHTKVITGDVFVNGVKIDPAKFRRKIAYVMQDDLLFATATARESLEFSARLRLPGSIAKDEAKIKIIVDDLLDSLGLTHVQNTYVGSEMIRGLSGGEKKRVAIGVELVTNPSLLFLDEPTSGLDSFSAWKVVKILENLSKSTGCATLCTIHQPSSEIFNSFKNVLMLAKGEVMYNGAVKELPDVLAALGHPLPSLTNPADFVMLLAQTLNSEKDLPKFNIDENDVLEDGKVIKSGTNNVQELLNKHNKEADSTWTDKGSSKQDSTAGMFTQTKLLCYRQLQNLTRDIAFLIISFGIRIFLNIMFGLVFFQAGDRSQNDYLVSSAFGSLTMVFASAMFGAAQGPLIAFPLERGVMIREYQTGTYSSLPYLLSKLVIEIPEAFVFSVVALVCSAFLIGLEGNFMLLVCAAWLITLATASYAFVLGAAMSDPKKAQEFAPLILVPQLLFTGLFVPISSVPKWLRWAQYLCVLKYGVNIGTLVEFQTCDDVSEFDSLEEINGFKRNCTGLLKANDMDIDDVWWYILIILCIFAVCRVLSLAIMVYRAKYFTN